MNKVIALAGMSRRLDSVTVLIRPLRTASNKSQYGMPCSIEAALTERNAVFNDVPSFGSFNQSYHRISSSSIF